MNVIKIQEQLDSNRRTVSFDSYDISVKQLYDMTIEGMIDIAPEYQRHFKWEPERQSALIESLFLGIPIPSLFMATNQDASWEVVDGLQRLTTILNFIGDAHILSQQNIAIKPLTLTGLEKLDSMNGLNFSDLAKSMQITFLTRPLRVTVLNDRSDFSVRYDLFERLNTGGITLHEQEIRNCIFIGEFNDLLKDLAQNQAFRAVVKMTENAERGGSYEELVLRFFAYLEDREAFVHSVNGFLNSYMDKKTKTFKNKQQLTTIFAKTFEELSAVLPMGIVRLPRKNITPIVLFEAISVGLATAITSGTPYDATKIPAMLTDRVLKRLTTGATNTKKMVFDRINHVVSSIAE